MIVAEDGKKDRRQKILKIFVELYYCHNYCTFVVEVVGFNLMAKNLI